MRSGEHMTIQSIKQNKGFTIVELLIVIVVIGILAAITIVAYNGIQNRAKIASIQSDLTSASKKLKLYQVDNNGYPASIDCSASPVANSICLRPTSGGTYVTYLANNSASPQTFCLAQTNGTLTYDVDQDTGPTTGGCVITNLITNPSVETGIASYTGNNVSSAIAASTARALPGAGTSSILTSAQNTTNGYNGWVMNTSLPVLTAGVTYTFSAWVYLNTAYGTSGVAATINGGGLGIVHGNFVTTVGAWTRTSVTFTPLTSGAIPLYVITGNAVTVASPSSFHSDGIMLTQGPTLYNYADGSFTGSGWAWTGTANATTSFGLPL